MNINFKFLLLGTGLSLIPTLTQAQCVATTDCATLGYTQTSCPDGKGIKCPFGNTYACPMTEEVFCKKYNFEYDCKGAGYVGGNGVDCHGKYASCACVTGYVWNNGKCEKEALAGLGQCTGYAKNCKIGDILNSDGTCSSDKVSGKTPLGIVVYIDKNGCGQALALQEFNNIRWGGSQCSSIFFDVPELPNLSREEDALEDFGSCSNTKIIVDYVASYTNWYDIYPAVYVAKNFVPVGAPETKGKWCLPAVGVGKSISDNFLKIQQALEKVGGQPISEADNRLRVYYSSSEDGGSVWTWDYSCKGLMLSGKVDGLAHLEFRYVRPVIEF